ncbi:hypothetical protein KIW84_071238 [Lathyrus oleraceus]|uniref:Membrane lipoprotein n=1 Tax=Pisum sativum TaxID=3888 RepID=A0A9D4VHS5_PEA|nr:hypothetical protein KIW84_071238 [Pisum sativum]
MPVSDPSSGRKFIWVVACFLFISLIAGGACLVAYMYLPESETSSWVPVVGVGLVCLPWAFWFFTCLYRIFSRCLGCRVGLMSSGGANQSRNGDVEVAAQSTKGGSSSGGELNRASSVASHESEMALAKSISS